MNCSSKALQTLYCWFEVNIFILSFSFFTLDEIFSSHGSVTLSPRVFKLQVWAQLQMRPLFSLEGKRMI